MTSYHSKGEVVIDFQNYYFNVLVMRLFFFCLFSCCLAVRMPCNEDDECVDGAHCMVGNNTMYAGKRCYCKSGYYEENMMCNGIYKESSLFCNSWMKKYLYYMYFVAFQVPRPLFSFPCCRFFCRWSSFCKRNEIHILIEFNQITFTS